MRPVGAHHVAIKARDVERVAAFYRDVLGLPEMRRHHYAASDRLRSVWLACDPIVLMVERAEVPSPEPEKPSPCAGGWGAPERPGLHLLALRIRDEDAARWCEHLEALGHPIVHATPHTLYVLDPEGNRVGLSRLDF